MNLFVLAIGGTGSRVLKSMVMQLAAGVVPVDHLGKPIKNLTIVPIIIDPHNDNAALTSVNRLLEDYRTIRKQLHGDKEADNGFFAVRIETLKGALSPDFTRDIDNSFIYKMTSVSNTSFEDFLNYDGFREIEDQLFTQMLFSKGELETKMSEGFYGSPNIGTVALQIFQKSPDYQTLLKLNKEDRLFFIGSIFGGTGAAGMPMLVSSLRNSPGENINKIPYGALVMMPYFRIETDPESPINEADFYIKTATALDYYVDNFNKYVNSIYYVADTELPREFPNDPGKDKQIGNKSHIAEFIGGMSIFNFLSQKFSENDIYQDNGEVITAGSTQGYHYTLIEGQNRNANHITFVDLDNETRKVLALPMMKFHLLIRYIQKHLSSNENKEAFASQNGITKSSLAKEFNDLMEEYDRWLFEMSDHGSGAHNLNLFMDTEGEEYNRLFNDIEPKKGGFLGKKEVTLDLKSIHNAFNNEQAKWRSNNGLDEYTHTAKLLKLAAPALENVIKEKLELKNVGL